MKIVIITNSSKGLFNFRQEFIKALAYNNEIISITPNNGYINELKLIGCSIIDCPIDRRSINPVKDFSVFKFYIKNLKEVHPDLVITYTIKPNIYGAIAANILRIPYVCNITGLGTAFQKDNWLKKIAVIMYRFALKKARVVFFENKDNRSVFLKEKIVQPKKTYVLRGAGVNLEHYTVLDYPNGYETIFLFLGRIMQEKGVDELFKAMKKLVSDGEKVQLLMVGDYIDNYQEIICQNMKEKWLSYYGYQSDIIPYVVRSHCFVLPSWHEGMSNTILESAACGRPTITSNIPGCKEAVIDEVSGFLVEPKNWYDLYIKMKKFINLPYEIRKNMGLAGRKHVENHFDRTVVVEDTVEQIINRVNL